jgi:hypothetical protein
MLSLCYVYSSRWPYHRPLVALAHFWIFYLVTIPFFSCLFFTIVNGTHIRDPPSLVSILLKYLTSKFSEIGLSVQSHKCVDWFPLGQPSDFTLPTLFNTSFDGFKSWVFQSEIYFVHIFFHWIFFIKRAQACWFIP